VNTESQLLSTLRAIAADQETSYTFLNYRDIRRLVMKKSNSRRVLWELDCLIACAVDKSSPVIVESLIHGLATWTPDILANRLQLSTKAPYRGICASIHEDNAPPTHNGLNRLALKTLFYRWPKYSGQIDYPIPDPTGKFKPITAFGQAQDSGTMWDLTSEHGRLRHDLWRYLLDELARDPASVLLQNISACATASYPPMVIPFVENPVEVADAIEQLYLQPLQGSDVELSAHIRSQVDTVVQTVCHPYSDFDTWAERVHRQLRGDHCCTILVDELRSQGAESD